MTGVMAVPSTAQCTVVYRAPPAVMLPPWIDWLATILLKFGPELIVMVASVSLEATSHWSLEILWRSLNGDQQGNQDFA